MARLPRLIPTALAALSLVACGGLEAADFIRGDANMDGVVWGPSSWSRTFTSRGSWR